MTSFLKSAKHVFDVESDLSYVEIVYDRYTMGKGYSTYTDYMNTEPLADWTYLESTKRSFLKSAKHVFDVESDLSYVEIVYDRYTIPLT